MPTEHEAQRGLDAGVRLPAVAGAFYPANPATLAAEVAEFLHAAEAGLERPAPVALTAPHAGYVYSGAKSRLCASILARSRPEDIEGL